VSEMVVIGGTSGVGRALAARYADRGAAVVVAGRDAGRAEQVAAELAAGGGRVRGIAADLRRPERLGAALAGVGEVHALVLAGMERDLNTVADYDVARAVELATVKVVGYTAAVHALLPRLTATASVLLFGGVAKDVPYPGSTTVSAVNGAVVGMVRTLSVELAPVRVNAIHPGLVADTPHWAGNAAVLERGRRAVLTGRLPTTRDVVDACALLLDNAAANGIDLPLHGGLAGGR
jgi:NAD(P)-dependent dehydrogenase (short-subunit alcohol dehydrogenase family)